MYTTHNTLTNFEKSYEAECELVIECAVCSSALRQESLSVNKCSVIWCKHNLYQ